MTHKVVTCLAEDDFQQALEAMSEHLLRRFPVEDQDDKVTGIIPQADVAAQVDKPKKSAEMVTEISPAIAK